MRIRKALPLFLFYLLFAQAVAFSANHFGVVTAKSGAKLRDGPSIKGTKIDLIPFGQRIEIIGESSHTDSIENTTAKWLSVVYGTKKGWVFGGLVQIEKEPEPTSFPPSSSNEAPDDDLENSEADDTEIATQTVIFQSKNQDTIKFTPKNIAQLWRCARMEGLPYIEMGKGYFDDEIIKLIFGKSLADWNDSDFTLLAEGIEKYAVEGEKSGGNPIVHDGGFKWFGPKNEEYSGACFTSAGYAISEMKPKVKDLKAVRDKLFNERSAKAAQEAYEREPAKPIQAESTVVSFNPLKIARLWCDARMEGLPYVSIGKGYFDDEAIREIFGKSLLDWEEPDFLALEVAIRKFAKEGEKAGGNAIVHDGGFNWKGLNNKEYSSACYTTAEYAIQEMVPKVRELRNAKTRIIESIQEEKKRIAQKQQAEIENQKRQKEENERRARVEQENKEKNKPKELTTEEKFYIGLGLLGLVVVWHLFIRRRCTKCRSTNWKLVDSEEVDRFIGDKQIDIKNKKGEKIGEQHVSVTYVRERFTYKCLDCGHLFSEIEKRELS